MARGVFFSESLWGFGHAKRMDYFVKRTDDSVYFHAGPKSSIQAIELPSLFEYEGLAGDNLPRKESLEQLLDERLKIFKENVSGTYDFYMIEMFPFAKEGLIADFLAHVMHLKKESPNLKVYCSFRGYNQVNYDGRDLGKRLKLFDKIFVHTDKNVLCLEDTISGIDFSGYPIIYTGFVAEEEIDPLPREKKITVSLGAGFQAQNLLRILPALKSYSEFKIEIYTGPYCPKEIKEKAVSKGFITHEFTDNFRKVLAASALSISMGGYNTLMDLLQTKTPAVVVRGASDQKVLAKVLAERGLLQEINSKALTKEALVSKIEAALKWQPPADYSIDFDGITTTISNL